MANSHLDNVDLATNYSRFSGDILREARTSLEPITSGSELSSGLVANFDFLDSKWQTGDQHQRQVIAAKELKRLIAQLANQVEGIFRLPITRFGRLEVDNQGEHYIQRRSCCMHYKRADGGYCQGCPNAPLSK
ncbi:(2Fe-2S)-binding protein [Vibrio wakamikoensis]|uniref:(2Fe-2S)-binding protein n=1 Tax=Vibrio chaetopteri TaxID=3016528 RepID=A0AAU8BIT6_9VIBR